MRFSNTTGILQKKKTMWFIGVEVEHETSAPPPKRNPGSAPVTHFISPPWNINSTNSNAICMSTSIIMVTANLRDILENLFDCSSLVACGTFSSETSLFLFAEAAVTPVGNQSQVR